MCKHPASRTPFSGFSLVNLPFINFKTGIARAEWTPEDLESELGLPSGHVHHGDMAHDQMFARRPVAGYADYRTPIAGLYLCGAATHPGGGVMGAPGRNAAREILRDLKSR